MMTANFRVPSGQPNVCVVPLHPHVSHVIPGFLVPRLCGDLGAGTSQRSHVAEHRAVSCGRHGSLRSRAWTVSWWCWCHHWYAKCNNSSAASAIKIIHDLKNHVRLSRNMACDEDACQMHFWKHGPPMKNPEIHGPITRIYRGTWAFRAWWTPIASPSVANLRWPVCRTGIRTAESLVNISPGFCIVVISFPLISWGCSWGLSFESGFVSGIHRIYDDIWDWPFGDWTVCNGKSTMFDL